MSDATIEAMRLAAGVFNGAAARMLVAKPAQWPERERAFLIAWIDLQAAMLPFANSQGTRGLDSPPPRSA